jgi:ribosome-associated protein
LAAKSTELCRNLLFGGENANAPPEENLNVYCMDTDYKSRTRKKNEDRALQRLGEQLVALPFVQLEAMELPGELLTSIEFARKISSRGARRRQIQYIGVLMRHIDPKPIETALERIRSGNSQK